MSEASNPGSSPGRNRIAPTTDWRVACGAVIPCLDEERTIGPIVDSLRSMVAAVVVVDDGSRDRTEGVARDAGAIVVRNGRTRGKGAALQTGVRKLRELGLGWAALLDGDGQHRPEDLPAFFRAAEETGAEMVVGNRMASSHEMARVRRWANRVMSKLLSRKVGRSLPDTQCGYRLVRLDTWARLSLMGTGFEMESEMLVKACHLGLGIAFVSIPVVSSTRPSHIRPLADTLRWLVWWRALGRGSAP